MTYNVFSGTLNPTHSLTHGICLVVVCRLDAAVNVVIMVSITQTSVVVNLGTVSKTSIKLQLSVMLPLCV